uniref:Gfo/Idh/MocA family protein n=1 Tax=Nocardioides sp. TaxID=35761 RepID=UPI002B2731A8
RSIRWGILATGKIAHSFAEDLALVDDAHLVAVGSRTTQSARAFTDEHGGRPHGSYADLLADPDVEVVYVASPHALHLEHATAAFGAGKHVLCEKPLTVTLDQAEQMVALAVEHDLFLMEAMWTACHPVVQTVVDAVRSGRLGRPRHLHAELGFRVDAEPGDRMLDPALGASALLDMGIYPLTLAHLLLGEAETLHATADLSDRGIDLDVAITGRYPGGALATMSASMTSWSSRSASLATDLGRLDLADFHHPTAAVFTPYAGRGSGEEAGPAIDLLVESPTVLGRGYTHEILEVGRCLRAGLRESPLVPHAQTLTLMRQMEGLLGQVGVGFA